MDVGVRNALLVVAIGLVMLLLAMWLRRGRSRAARRWVLTTPRARTYYRVVQAEGAVLLVLPLLAAVVMTFGVGGALGELGLLVPWLETGLTWVLVAECVAAAAAGLVAHRILPLRVYPGWLRDERRAEKEAMDRARSEARS
jgi:hypothetical protein